MSPGILARACSVRMLPISSRSGAEAVRQLANRTARPPRWAGSPLGLQDLTHCLLLAVNGSLFVDNDELGIFRAASGRAMAVAELPFLTCSILAFDLLLTASFMWSYALRFPEICRRNKLFQFQHIGVSLSPACEESAGL